MVTQIIGIEINIYKLLEINSIEPTFDMEQNLEILFEIYIENNFYRNALMYIYYVLYCKLGYQLRDKIMHGDLIAKGSYVRELIMIYACMIIINFMISH